jgi:hypothetical protein
MIEHGYGVDEVELGQHQFPCTSEYFVEASKLLPFSFKPMIQRK